MNTPVVRLNHVNAGPRARRILDDINLVVEAGHFLGIVGPNGAGKSTLLHMIAGLIKPEAGHIDLFGECLSRSNRRRLLARTGFLSQKRETPSILPLRVRDVVALGFASYHTPLWHRRRDKIEIEKTLALTGTTALAGKDFRHLSGGQQQRVRLARTLVASPRLLLLDEPAAALDARAQDSLYALLRRLCDEQDVAIIMVEHDIAAISGFVDSVACLNVRIHHHALHGEVVPEDVWRVMYGDHMHIVAHDAHCIGCADHGDDA
ncbi:MAG: metal ABC transporter ATP-binding protein [Mariprofundaceae bacterium]|nr:metal ABC transporter ATP-binding protein [Mariprofundaceae bacterium]